MSKIKPKMIEEAIQSARVMVNADGHELVCMTPAMFKQLRAALESPEPAPAPTAWHVRSLGQFKKFTPGPWRYVDGPAKPKVNIPEECEFEAMYGLARQEPDIPQDSLC